MKNEKSMQIKELETVIENAVRPAIKEFASEVRMLQSTLERIKYLEHHYLAAVRSYSHTMNCSIKEAWQTIEDERHELGLRPRFTSYQSFMNYAAKENK